MNPIITISIIEDDVKFGLLLKKIIEVQSNMACLNIYTNLKSSLSDLAINVPDVVLLDVQLPDGLGSEYVDVLKKVSPNTLFIMCTSFEDEDYIFNSLKNGASGYLLKTATPEKIIDSINDVLQGGAPMTPAIAKKVIQHFRVEQKNLAELSKKENEILQLLSTGLFYKEIANKLGVTIDTVKKHSSSIYKKLQVNNRTEAVNMFKK